MREQLKSELHNTIPILVTIGAAILGPVLVAAYVNHSLKATGFPDDSGLGFFCPLVFFLLLASPFAFAMIQHLLVVNAREEYRDELATLRRNPENARIREKVLYLGRKYATAARKSQGILIRAWAGPIFDETMLMNDINAACSRANRRTPEVNSKASVVERMAALDSLLAQGAITREEHKAKRKQILDDL